MLANNSCILKYNNNQEASSCKDFNLKNNTNLSNSQSHTSQVSFSGKIKHVIPIFVKSKVVHPDVGLTSNMISERLNLLTEN